MFDGLDKDQKLKAGRRLFEETHDLWFRWFKKMTEDFQFHAGGEQQWDPQDLALLRAQKRPTLTFNLMKVIIRELIGAQEDAKREAKAVPVGREDQGRAEVLNRLWRCVRRQTDADFAESEAFEKGSIGGIAYAVVDVNPKPGRPDWVEFLIQPIHPFECMVDPACQRRDMRDAQFIFWNRWMRDSKFMQAYPEHADAVKDLWKGLREEGMGLHEVPENSQDQPTGATSPIDLPGHAADSLYLDRRKRLIRVVHLEYRCPKRAYYAVNPQTGDPEPISKTNYDRYKGVVPIEMASVWEDEVYWLEFIGDRILFDDIAPVNKRCFSIESFVCDRDHLTGEPVGLLRDLKDPQREINKRSSQELHHTNQQGAPGYLAETNAVKDVKQFEESLKTAGSTSWLNPGGLPKVIPRQLPQVSAAVVEVLDRAVRMFMRIGGVDIDTLTGQRSADEPATTALLRYRKSILAVTKSLQNYHSFQSRLLKNTLYILATSVPDKQIEQMLGDAKRWRVQDGMVIDLQSQESFSLAGMADDDWDIEMDVAAANTTVALLTLQILIQMAQVGVPIDPDIMIESLPIAQDKKNQMLAYIEAQQAAQSKEAQTQQEELTKRLDLDAAIEKFKATREVADTAEGMRHNRELETIQLLKGQRDFLVDLLNVAKEQQQGTQKNLFDSLTKILDYADKKMPGLEGKPAAAPLAPPMMPFVPPPAAPPGASVPGLA